MADPTPFQALRLRLASRSARMPCSTAGGEAAVNSAAAQLGIDPAQARLAFPKDAPQ